MDLAPEVVLAVPVLDVDQEDRVANFCQLGNTNNAFDQVRHDDEARQEVSWQVLADDCIAQAPTTCAHIWPDELDVGAQCLDCRLDYGSWTESEQSDG